MVISIRAFRPGTTDDAGAKSLEAHASQHAHNPVLSTLVRIHFQHLTSFDAKARQYTDSIVLVAIDNSATSAPGAGSDGFVCGCICVGIKEAWLQGSPRRLGYLFDLRVHEAYQRNSLGTRLNSAAEEAARERGVDTIYLTVNESNPRARTFYLKHGYSLGSERALLFTPLLMHSSRSGRSAAEWRRSPLPEARMRRVDAREAARVVDTSRDTLSQSAGATGKDLALVAGLGSLFEQLPGKRVESWVAELGGAEPSLAALTLWDGDGTTSFHVERVILTPATWRHPATQGALLLADGALMGCWVRWLWYAPWGPLKALVGLGFGLALGGGILGTMLLRFITSRQRFRARLIAPVASGPHGVELLKGLVQHAMGVARAQGFSLAIANLDVLDPIMPAFQRNRPRPRTFFLQKRLGEGGERSAAEDVPRFGTDCFFDPRDLS